MNSTKNPPLGWRPQTTGSMANLRSTSNVVHLHPELNATSWFAVLTEVVTNDLLRRGEYPAAAIVPWLVAGVRLQQ